MVSLAKGVLGSWLFSRTRAAVLSRLLFNDSEVSASDFAVEMQINRFDVEKELRDLTKAGIANERKAGGVSFFSANPICPILPELRSILAKTTGIADPIRTALIPIRHKIKLAYIYGSIANGNSVCESDIDLMIVGDTGLFEIVSALMGADKIIARPINPVVYSEKEYIAELLRMEGFVYSVHYGERIVILGDDIDLRQPTNARNS